MKKLTFILLLALACSRREQSVAEAADTATPRPAMAAPAAQTEQQTPVPRMIVRTAEVRIVVADTSRTVEAVTKSNAAITSSG